MKHHKRLRIGKIIHQIDKKVISPIGKQIVKPIWKQATKTINAPMDIAKTAVDRSGNLALPILIVGGVAVVFLLTRR